VVISFEDILLHLLDNCGADPFEDAGEGFGGFGVTGKRLRHGLSDPLSELLVKLLSDAGGPPDYLIID
jgi:hypothetical protein